jgi:hypothetical protein
MLDQLLLLDSRPVPSDVAAAVNLLLTAPEWTEEQEQQLARVPCLLAVMGEQGVAEHLRHCRACSMCGSTLPKAWLFACECDSWAACAPCLRGELWRQLHKLAMSATDGSRHLAAHAGQLQCQAALCGRLHEVSPQVQPGEQTPEEPLRLQQLLKQMGVVPPGPGQLSEDHPGGVQQLQLCRQLRNCRRRVEHLHDMLTNMLDS